MEIRLHKAEKELSEVHGTVENLKEEVFGSVLLIQQNLITGSTDCRDGTS